MNRTSYDRDFLLKFKSLNLALTDELKASLPAELLASPPTKDKPVTCNNLKEDETPEHRIWIQFRRRHITKSEQAKHELTKRKFKGLLNKLTTSNFASIYPLLLNETYDFESSRILVKLIFVKAMIEPKFSGLYASLCVELSKNQKMKSFLFKNTLLNVCKKTFEKFHYQKKILSLQHLCTNTIVQENLEDKRISLLPLDLRQILLKKKIIRQKEEFKKAYVFGNINFLGELFKHKVISQRLIIQIISALFAQVKKYEETCILVQHLQELEVICRLLHNIGELLDTKQNEKLMATYMDTLQDLSGSPDLDTRLKFIILDVLERRTGYQVSKQTN